METSVADFSNKESPDNNVKHQSSKTESSKELSSDMSPFVRFNSLDSSNEDLLSDGTLPLDFSFDRLEGETVLLFIEQAAYIIFAKNEPSRTDSNASYLNEPATPAAGASSSSIIAPLQEDQNARANSGETKKEEHSNGEVGEVYVAAAPTPGSASIGGQYSEVPTPRSCVSDEASATYWESLIQRLEGSGHKILAENWFENSKSSPRDEVNDPPSASPSPANSVGGGSSRNVTGSNFKSSLGSGLYKASASVGYGLMKGATGLVSQAMKGKESGGIFGMAKGFGLGAFGLASHTVLGAVKGVGHVTSAVGEYWLGAAKHFSLDGSLVVTNLRVVWMARAVRDRFDIYLGSLHALETSNTSPHILHLECKDSFRPTFGFFEKEDCLRFQNAIMEQYRGTAYMFAPLHQRRRRSKEQRTREEEEEGWSVYKPSEDWSRLGLDNVYWRVYNNEQFKLPTYPARFVIPATITDADISEIATFRSAKRILAVVWKHSMHMATISRCAQPCVGLGGYTSTADQAFVEELRAPTQSSIYFIDARSSVAAAANAAAGKGTEDTRNYPNSILHHCGIANIHAVRNAFHILSTFCQPGTFRFSEKWNKKLIHSSQVTESEWFTQLSLILSSALMCANLVCGNQSVVVHCSDGWDRTAQLTSTAQLFIDPFYRTLTGFICLIEKEWCSFGHMFRSRCCHGVCPNYQDSEDRSPVFVQWLDAVFQILRQAPWAFEFNDLLLEEIYRALYSCVYGTFLYDCEQQKVIERSANPTRSLWTGVLQKREKFINGGYDKERSRLMTDRCLDFRSEASEFDIWPAHIHIADPLYR